jgi:hypothetical protein
MNRIVLILWIGLSAGIGCYKRAIEHDQTADIETNPATGGDVDGDTDEETDTGADTVTDGDTEVYPDTNLDTVSNSDSMPPWDTDMDSEADNHIGAIAAGHVSTCAVVEGAAKCWGSDKEGQLGSHAATYYSMVPEEVLLQ